MQGILQTMSGLSEPNKQKSSFPTMANNVASNIASNSLLMNSAAAKGSRMAASRGLHNSTLGVESAQRAMLDAAMPIAQIDTANQHQLGMQREQNTFAAGQAEKDRAHQLGMQQGQHTFAAGQAEKDRAHQLGMQQGQHTFAAGQAEKDRAHQLGMQQGQHTFAAGQAEKDRAHQLDLARHNAELQHNNAMKELNAQVAANTMGKSIDFAMQIADNFDDQISAVQSNAKMSEADKKKAIEQLLVSRNIQLKFLESFMKAIPTKHQNWSSFPSLEFPTFEKLPTTLK